MQLNGWKQKYAGVRVDVTGAKFAYDASVVSQVRGKHWWLTGWLGGGGSRVLLY